MPALTIEQLRQHRTFTALSERLQNMVVAYLTNGRRRVRAIQVAYPDARNTSARTMACTHFQRPDVILCLNAASGMGERELFEEQLRCAMSNPKTSPSQVAALRMLGEMEGWLVKGTAGRKKKSTAAPAAPEPSSRKVSDFERPYVDPFR